MIILVLLATGCRYHISFVDVFSRFTFPWTYFVPDRSKCLATFGQFKCSVENLLTSRIKIIRSDVL